MPLELAGEQRPAAPALRCVLLTVRGVWQPLRLHARLQCRAGGACFSAGSPRLPVLLSKVACLCAALNLLTSPFCMVAKGTTNWAQVVALCHAILVLFGVNTPDEEYFLYAWLLLPGPVYDRVRNHGVLSGGRACAG